MPTITIGCDTIEKTHFFRDVLEKTINESPAWINREGAMSIIFDFYLKNHTKSKRTRELINRSEYYKKQKWRNEITEELKNYKIRKHEKMKAKLIIKLQEIINIIIRG